MSRLEFLFFSCLFLVAFWVLGLVEFIQFEIAAPNDKELQKADAIIVLTGGSGRIASGFELLEQGYAPQIFISGVDNNYHKEIANNMKVQKPISYDKIRLGYEAKNTYENASESFKFIAENKINNIILVTSNYHMPRSLIEFEEKMPGTNIIPYRVKSEIEGFESLFQSYRAVKLSVNEYNKWIIRKYFIQYYHKLFYYLEHDFKERFSKKEKENPTIG